MIAKVVTDIALDKEFDYLVPDNLGNQIRIGSAVDVPFGHQVRQGFVLDLTNKSYYAQDKLRAIIGISKTRASIPEKLIELGKWMAEYYCCTLEQSIRTLLPAAVRSGDAPGEQEPLGPRLPGDPRGRAGRAVHGNRPLRL